MSYESCANFNATLRRTGDYGAWQAREFNLSYPAGQTVSRITVRGDITMRQTTTIHLPFQNQVDSEWFSIVGVTAAGGNLNVRCNYQKHDQDLHLEIQAYLQ